jgi:FkbM family methyltransferase
VRAIRAGFSPRLASVLLENCITKNRRLPSVSIEMTELVLSVPMPCSVTLDLKDYTQADFYLNGLPPFFPLLLLFADENTIFLDIGANGGLVSLGMSRRVPARQIYAFEPVPATFQRLTDTFARNCPGAHAVNVAASREAGELTLQIPSSDSGSASALRSDSDLKNWHGVENVVSRLSVPAITIDEFLNSGLEAGQGCLKKFAIKIDVEGFEQDVLSGMEKFLCREEVSVLLIVETGQAQREAVTAHLRDRGFVPQKTPWLPAGAVDSLHHVDLPFLKIPAPPAQG